MSTVKQYITIEEIYPFYDISDSPYYSVIEVELSEEFYEEYVKTSQAFWGMQRKLRGIIQWQQENDITNDEIKLRK